MDSEKLCLSSSVLVLPHSVTPPHGSHTPGITGSCQPITLSVKVKLEMECEPLAMGSMTNELSLDLFLLLL